MDLTDFDLTFLQKNMLGMLHRSGGRMRYRDLCHKLNYSKVPRHEWYADYSGLLTDKLIRERRDPSTKRRDGFVNMVELAADNLPVFEVRRLDQQKREAEEEEHARAGWDAFIDGDPRKAPRVGAPYSPRWYRLKAAWLSGWDDAKAFEDRSHGKPEKGMRVLASMF